MDCCRVDDTIFCVNYRLIDKIEQKDFPLRSESFKMEMPLNDLMPLLKNQDSIMPDRVELKVTGGSVKLVIIDGEDYEN